MLLSKRKFETIKSFRIPVNVLKSSAYREAYKPVWCLFFIILFSTPVGLILYKKVNNFPSVQQQFGFSKVGFGFF